MDCQERRETRDKKDFQDLQEARENLEPLASQGYLVSKEIRVNLVFLAKMDQLATPGARVIQVVKDLPEQEADLEQHLLELRRDLMDCQGSPVFLELQEGMVYQGYPGQRVSPVLARMEKLAKKVRGEHRGR